MLTLDGLLTSRTRAGPTSRSLPWAGWSAWTAGVIGLSEPLEPDADPLEQWVEDVEAVIEAAGLRRPFLMANFDTGLVALEYAARRPDALAGLVLVNCYATYQRRPDYPYGLDEATTRDLIEGAVTHPATAPGHREPGGAEPRRRRRLPGVVDPDRPARSRPGDGAHGPHRGQSTDLRPRLAARDGARPGRSTGVSAPTSTPATVSYLADHLPRAELRMVDGVDGVWFSRPDDVLEEAAHSSGADVPPPPKTHWARLARG